MYLLIDNYDSFTYILRDYLLQLKIDCRVYKNDEIDIAGIQNLSPQKIIISPGPETPEKSGICMEVIHHFHQTTPILGICLGHQAIGQYFGASLSHAPYPLHGKTSWVAHRNHPLFHNIPSPFEVMRYHSLILENIPQDIITLAYAEDDKSVMAIAHKDYPCVGLQFHPESIGTKYGLEILKNWGNYMSIITKQTHK